MDWLFFPTIFWTIEVKLANYSDSCVDIGITLRSGDNADIMM
jgi:hypothetical protein